ncbi:MAG: hypothetical protein HRF45_12365 [Fimbriimonadia bacterium]
MGLDALTSERLGRSGVGAEAKGYHTGGTPVPPPNVAMGYHTGGTPVPRATH